MTGTQEEDLDVKINVAKQVSLIIIPIEAIYLKNKQIGVQGDSSGSQSQVKTV